eukprot:UN02833
MNKTPPDYMPRKRKLSSNLSLVPNKRVKKDINDVPMLKSQYRGVFWDRTKRRWRSRAYYGGKLNSLGSWVQESDAAKAHDKFLYMQSRSTENLNFPALAGKP